MKLHVITLIACVLFIVYPTIGSAQISTKLARETSEYVLGKFAKEATGETIETMAKKSDDLIRLFGEDGMSALRKVGPSTFELVGDAGEYGLKSVRLLASKGDDAIWIVANKSRLELFAKYGDDAAEAMLKHREIAEPFIKSYGANGGKALAQVNSQNGRRLCMLAEDGSLSKLGKTDELLGVVSKYGDQAADFIWRNKVGLASGAALIAFLRDPVPFINGSVSLAKVAADAVAKPIAIEIGKQTNWTLIAGSVIALIAGWSLISRPRILLKALKMIRFGRKNDQSVAKGN